MILDDMVSHIITKGHDMILDDMVSHIMKGMT